MIFPVILVSMIPSFKASAQSDDLNAFFTPLSHSPIKTILPAKQVLKPSLSKAHKQFSHLAFAG